MTYGWWKAASYEISAPTTDTGLCYDDGDTTVLHTDNLPDYLDVEFAVTTLLGENNDHSFIQHDPAARTVSWFTDDETFVGTYQVTITPFMTAVLLDTDPATSKVNDPSIMSLAASEVYSFTIEIYRLICEFEVPTLENL